MRITLPFDVKLNLTRSVTIRMFTSSDQLKYLSPSSHDSILVPSKSLAVSLEKEVHQDKAQSQYIGLENHITISRLSRSSTEADQDIHTIERLDGRSCVPDRIHAITCQRRQYQMLSSSIQVFYFSAFPVALSRVTLSNTVDITCPYLPFATHRFFPSSLSPIGCG